MEHLIPQHWFDGQASWLLLVVVAAAMTALIKGAGWLVEGAAGLAYRLGIPKITVGATIVSLGTTSPEAAVSVMAAWSGRSGLALGNAVGSVIADTALIFGLGCLLVALPADRFVLSRQGWVQFGAGLLLALLCYGAFAFLGDAASLGRPVGLVLLVLLVAYLVASVRWSLKHPFGEPFVAPVNGSLDGVPASGQPPPGRGLPALSGAMLAGLVIVVFSSRVLVCAVTSLAQRWHVPEVVIAATLVALGTSLPELTVGLASVLRGHGELLVGNVIGADVLNVLFVIGASAVAAPLPVVEAGSAIPRLFLTLHLPVMLAVLMLFRLFIFLAVRRGSFRPLMGLPLVALYVAYVVVQILITRP